MSKLRYMDGRVRRAPPTAVTAVITTKAAHPSKATERLEPAAIAPISKAPMAVPASYVAFQAALAPVRRSAPARSKLSSSVRFWAPP